MSTESDFHPEAQPAVGAENWSRPHTSGDPEGPQAVGICASPSSWPGLRSVDEAHEVLTPRSTCKGEAQSFEMLAQLTPLPPTPNTRRRRSSQTVAAAEACRFSSPAAAYASGSDPARAPTSALSSSENQGADHSVCESGFATPKFKQKEQDQWDPLLLSPSAPKRRRGSASVERQLSSDGAPSYEVTNPVVILSAAASALTSLGCGLWRLASCRPSRALTAGMVNRDALGDNADAPCGRSPTECTDDSTEDACHSDGGNCCIDGFPAQTSSSADQWSGSLSCEEVQNGNQDDGFENDARGSHTARGDVKRRHLSVPVGSQHSVLSRSQSRKLLQPSRLKNCSDCQYLCSGSSSSSSTTSTSAFTLGGGDSSSSDIQNIKTGVPEGDASVEADGISHKVLTIPVVEGFSFTMAICSYGFFCMMPNQWIPPKHPQAVSHAGEGKHDHSWCGGKELDGSTGDGDRDGGVFKRPLRYGEQMIRCCNVEITCRSGVLRVALDGDLPRNDAEVAQIKAQVRRMCRLDQLAFRSRSVSDFWKMHPDAAKRKFGFLFRSPTVWEDMVKTLTLCNVRWKQSCLMNTQLCLKASSVPGSFPSPWDILRFSPAELQKMTSLGYRAERLHRLAESIVCGSVNMAIFGDVGWTMNRMHDTRRNLHLPTSKISEKSRDYPRKGSKNELPGVWNDPLIAKEAIVKTLRSIHGFGTYATENMLQLLGFFDVCAFDSETIRHMAEKHGIKNKSATQVRITAERIYKKYAPFQFLAYWFELWEGYEAKVGTISPYWTASNSSFVSNGVNDVKKDEAKYSVG